MRCKVRTQVGALLVRRWRYPTGELEERKRRTSRPLRGPATGRRGRPLADRAPSVRHRQDHGPNGAPHAHPSAERRSVGLGRGKEDTVVASVRGFPVRAVPLKARLSMARLASFVMGSCDRTPAKGGTCPGHPDGHLAKGLQPPVTCASAALGRAGGRCEVVPARRARQPAIRRARTLTDPVRRGFLARPTRQKTMPSCSEAQPWQTSPRMRCSGGTDSPQ